MGFASSRRDRKLHVVYLADNRLDEAGFGEPVKGVLVLRAAASRYRVRTLASGAVEWANAGSVASAGGKTQIRLPEFRRDCALVVTAEGL
jgi:hypothetical protein